MNSVEHFLNRLSAEKFENCFNPYSDNCPIHDNVLAPQIRRRNLSKVLHALLKEPYVDLWVGRDLGYKGGRRTGLALTDEYSIDAYAKHLNVRSFERGTKGLAVKERTASNIARILEVANCQVMTWNVFPFHPHQAGKAFSNRNHTREEAERGFNYLREIISLLSIRRVVAIGNDAAKWTKNLGPQHYQVRHPSYGGQNEFLQQMEDIYSVRRQSEKQMRLF